MTGMQMMIGALGIKIPEADIKALEELLPKVPALVINATHTINQALKLYDARLTALEQQNEKLIELMEASHANLERRDGTRTDGNSGSKRITNGSGNRKQHS
jgi:hypothetical protein